MTKRNTSTPCLPCRQKTLDNKVSTMSMFVGVNLPVGFAIGGVIRSAVIPTYRWFEAMQFTETACPSSFLVWMEWRFESSFLESDLR